MSGGIVEVCALDFGGEEKVRAERTGEHSAREERGGAETPRVFDVPVSARKRRAIVKALTEKAAAGDVAATAFLFDRMYGRPGVAVKGASNESADMVRLDLRRLNEEEAKTFARLFQKCIVQDGETGRVTRGPVARRRVALSARAGGIRE